MSLKSLLGKTIQLLPDKPFVYLWFYKVRHERLNLRKPLKYTHKIQWLKLNGNLERFTTYADKYTVRPYIADKIGDKYLIPLLGVWDKFDDINFDELPKRFVLKATHGSGYNYVCKDKATIDRASLKAMFDRWTSENFYRLEREPQYKNCQPRIVAEAYLEDSSGGLRDYKFYCDKGEPKAIQVDTDRFTYHRSELLDTNWHKLDYVDVKTFGALSEPVKKPANLAAMLDVARKLAADFVFVRVDLYTVGNKIYFGELTFTPGSGMADLQPASGDVKFGNMIDLDSYNMAPRS